MDLKRPEAVEAVLDMVEQADGLIEGFRPGVMERLGLGPTCAWSGNPKLVFGRMTGWGQHGTIAHAAGHDINLHRALGRAALDRQRRLQAGAAAQPRCDFGGGGMLLALGVVAGLLEARSPAKGQVVDAAMTDGSALLLAAVVGMHGSGVWKDERGSNMLDSGSHFYDTYECADGKYVSVGSLEPQFYALLREKAGLDAAEWDDHLMRRDQWPELKAKLPKCSAPGLGNEWCEIMEGSDVCFAPVLSISEAVAHPHNRARQTFVEVEGVPQPAPAPRFSRTTVASRSAAKAGEHNGRGACRLGVQRGTD